MHSFPGHSLFFCMSPVRHFSHSKLFYGSNKCFTAHVLGLSYLLTSTNQEEFVLQLALLFFFCCCFGSLHCDGSYTDISLELGQKQFHCCYLNQFYIMTIVLITPNLMN